VVGQVQTFVDEHLAADLTVKQRVERVKRLLATTDCSLASIALDTGFYDQAHLTRTFKRLEGVTPGTYRDEADE
jgi:AraC family transcriptional regulator